MSYETGLALCRIMYAIAYAAAILALPWFWEDIKEFIRG